MEFRYLVSPDGREIRESCIGCLEEDRPEVCYHCPYSEASQGLGTDCERVNFPVTNDRMNEIEKQEYGYEAEMQRSRSKRRA